MKSSFMIRELFPEDNEADELADVCTEGTDRADIEDRPFESREEANNEGEGVAYY